MSSCLLLLLFWRTAASHFRVSMWPLQSFKAYHWLTKRLLEKPQKALSELRLFLSVYSKSSLKRSTQSCSRGRTRIFWGCYYVCVVSILRTTLLEHWDYWVWRWFSCGLCSFTVGRAPPVEDALRLLLPALQCYLRARSSSPLTPLKRR